MNRKGFTLTISMLLIGLMLIALFSSAEKQLGQAKENLKFFSTVEKVSYKYENIEDNILEIMEEVAGISFDVNDTAIFFTESLPEKQKKDKFELNVADYRNFALRYKDGMDININNESIELDNLNIYPYDVNYMHSDSPGKSWRKNNILVIQPSSINFSGYILKITLQNQDYNSVSTNFKSCSGQCTTPIYFDLNILNSSKIQQAVIHQENIDPFKSSTVTIQTTGQAPNDIQITIGDDGQLEVKNNNAVPIDVVSGIDFGDSATAIPRLRFAKDLIIVSSDLGIEKR